MKGLEWINNLREGAFELLQKDINNELEDYYIHLKKIY